MHQIPNRLIVLILAITGSFLLIVTLRSATNQLGVLPFLQGHRVEQKEDTADAATLAEDTAISSSQVSYLQDISDQYAMLSEAVMPSVVSINTEGVEGRAVVDLMGRQQLQRSRTTGQGSGVIVSQEGHVITNYHVIAEKQRIYVIHSDNRKYKAKIIGSDPGLDIAVLKIESNNTFQPLKFGNSDDMDVGNVVLAFGNPFAIGRSVTNGIISARERSISDKQGGLLQSSAAVNPGYSGGPLINVLGEIVGINSTIYSSDQDNPGFQGISFAIPSNVVKKTFMDILQRGRPVRGFLGVMMNDISQLQRHQLHYDRPYGALVGSVGMNTPAEKAGLQSDDIIMNYNGKRVRDYTQLISLVHHSPINQPIDITIWRSGQEKTIQAVIEEYDAGVINQASEHTLGLKETDVEKILKAVGIQVRNIPADYRRRGMSGVMVTNILQGSQSEGKLQRGDIITTVDTRSVHQINQFYRYVLFHIIKRDIQLIIERPGASEPIKISLPRLQDY